MVETGTGSSATTSGSAVGLSARAPSSWASSKGVLSFDLSLVSFFFFFFFLGGPAASLWSRGSTTSSSASRGCFLPWLEASGAGFDGLVRVPSLSGSLGNLAESPGGSSPLEPHSSPAVRWEVVAWPFASDSLPHAFSCQSCILKRRWAPFILEMSSFFPE